MRYRKNPVVIEAKQWDGTVEGATQIIDWVLEGGGTARYHEEAEEPLTVTAINLGEEPTVIPAHIAVDTLDSTGRVFESDWMMRGTKGEHYPCKADVFAETYTEVDEDAPEGEIETATEWGVRFCDGEIEEHENRDDAEQYIADTRRDIEAGELDSEIYEPMTLMFRTVTTTAPVVGDWTEDSGVATS